jgi:hydroxymethylbilane synthase
LGFSARIAEHLSPALLVPAVGQGIIGIECRSDDAFTLDAVACLDDALAALCLATERAFSARLAGSCQSPVAGHAVLEGATLRLQGLVGAADGSTRVADSGTLTLTGTDESSLRAARADAEALGVAVAEKLLAAGAGDLLDAARAAEH